MAKPKPAPSTEKSLLADLKQIRRESRKERQGHRQYIVSAICKAFGIYLHLEADKQRRKAFLVLAEVPASHRPRANLAIEVLCYAVGTRTQVGQREASKRVRALKYLHKLKVPIKRMPAEIRNRGGIQKVYNEAVKKDPRTRKSKRSVDHERFPATGHALSNKAWCSEDKKANGANSAPLGNDRLQPLQIDILASDLDFLRDLEPGQKCRLRVVRYRDDAESRSLVRVLKVTTL